MLPLSLSPEDFRIRFEELKAALIGTPIEDELEFIQLVKGKPDVLSRSELSAFDQKFLTEVGLPEGISDLTFEGLAEGPLSLWEFDPHRDWTPAAKAPFEGLLYLGGDANGDPLCIEETTGAIFTLNHDAHFERNFVNSSLLQLAYCAVVSLTGIVKQMERDHLGKQLAHIDADALRHGHHWSF